jgi:acetyl-CoA carboxylase biotin carboxyl carrier protein
MYYAPSPYPSVQPSMPAAPAGSAGSTTENAPGAPVEGGGERPSGATNAAAAGAETGVDTGLVEVKSPMVGTFYRAPAPEAPPYVEVGTRVSKGQTLCIIEAMKLMNEMESEIEGVVRQVLVDNSEPVEYGQVLFRIDPAG